MIELGGEAITCQGSVASDADCRRLVDAAVAEWGTVNYLVNNAGTTKGADYNDWDALTEEDWHTIFQTNVVGTYQMIRAARPHMVAAGGGSIVNISSASSRTGQGSSIAYASSKAALDNVRQLPPLPLAPPRSLPAIIISIAVAS